MILWSFRLLVIATVIGFRYYRYYGTFTGNSESDPELCPDLHAHVLDIHPHKCACKFIKKELAYA